MPTPSAVNTPSGVAISGDVGNGFEITAPAGTNLRTLTLYTGLWHARGKLEAALSDGSAPAFVDASFGNDAGSGNAVYTISYRAASEGQTLRLRYTLAGVKRTQVKTEN